MRRLTQRADFLAAATGMRVATPAFVVQARARGDCGPVRVGYTVSRQVGTAVERNRVRRRLREVVRLSPPDALRLGHDYVLVGRRPALQRAFGVLIEDFAGAVRRLERPGVDRRPARQRPPPRGRDASAKP